MNGNKAGSLKKRGFFRPWMPMILVAVLVILLALASWFFEPDYMAHVPLRIGVSAYDSSDAAPALEALADLVREKGGGDISWIYFEQSETPGGCDFYLMTSVQYLVSSEEMTLKAVLVAKSPGSSGLAPGVVVARPGTGDDELRSGRFLFPTPVSAAGFLSSYAALRKSGFLKEGSSPLIDFAGCRKCSEKVVFGVLYGQYAAGGLPLYDYQNILARGLISDGDLEILFTGPPVTELVLAAEPDMERWKESGFSQRLPVITGEAGKHLKTCLLDIGIAGFAVPGEKTIDFLDTLTDSTALELIYHRP